MTNKQLKNELKQQAYAAVPDKREELLKTVAAQSSRAASLSDDGDEPHLVPVVPATSRKTAERWLALAACFVVVLVAVIVATNRDDTQLTKRVIVGGDVTTTTTAFGTIPSASGSGETGGSVSGATGSSISQSGGTATLSAASGTQTTNASGLPLQTDSSRISGTLSGGTKQKGATAVTTQSTSKWRSDLGIDTTKGGNTTKLVPGSATTQKTVAPSAHPTTKHTIAPSAKPTTKPTTAPTTRPTEPTCNHMIEYRVPVSIDGRPVPAADACVNQPHIEEPTEPSAVPAAPTQGQPVVKDGFTYTVTYSEPMWATFGDKPYYVYTEVVFNDGWKTQYWSSCKGLKVLYTDVKTFTKSGVCTYEQTYNENSQLLTIIRRNQDGAITYQNTRSVPIGDSRFLVLY